MNISSEHLIEVLQKLPDPNVYENNRYYVLVKSQEEIEGGLFNNKPLLQIEFEKVPYYSGFKWIMQSAFFKDL